MQRIRNAFEGPLADLVMVAMGICMAVLGVVAIGGVLWLLQRIVI